MKESAASFAPELYYIVGVIVMTGFSSILTGVVFTIKQVVSYTKLIGRVEKLESDLNNAFKKIRKDEGRLNEFEQVTDSLEKIASLIDSKTRESSEQ